MSKKKKEPKLTPEQRLAEQKREFVNNIFSILKAFELDDCVKDFDTRALSTLFQIRLRSPKAIAAQGHDVPSSLINDFNYFIPRVISKDMLKIDNTNYEISLYNFLTVFLTLACTLPHITEEQIQSIERIKEKFSEQGWQVANIEVQPADFQKAIEMMDMIFRGICILYNSFERGVYWVRFQANDMTQEQRIANQIEILKIEPEQKHFIFDKSARPAYRVVGAATNFGPVRVMLTAEQIKLKSHLPKLEMEVYVQKHALNRLSERLDLLPECTLEYNLWMSVTMANVIMHNGRRLIEYYVGEHKAGYLVLDVQDGTVIIRTFLLLTNNGTPEADKLKELTGLSKADTKYLALDKISAFFSDDLCENTKGREIIVRAGCGSLINIYELNKDNLQKRGTQSTAKLLEEYLGLGEEVEIAEYQSN